MKNIALILASGTGSRCGFEVPKQFVKISQKTILEYTISAFENHNGIDEIYLVTSKEYIDKVHELIGNGTYSKVKSIIEGGETRKDSSYNGVSAINYPDANLLIHDGVRPFIKESIITNCIKALDKYDALCTVIDATDTIYSVNDDGIITSIPERSGLKCAQTPQCFKLSLIKKAHKLAKDDINCTVTDDCGLIMHYKLADIHTISGDINNIKITYPQDVNLAKYLIKT